MPQAAHIDSLLLTGIRTQGRRGFEQVHAASFDEAAVITGLAKGEMLADIPADKLRRILGRDGLLLVELIQDAYRRGVGGDIHAENIMVNTHLLRKSEFTLIDMSPSNYIPDEDPVEVAAGLIEREDIPGQAMRNALLGKK